MSANFNENNAAVLVDGMVLLFETSVEKLVLGYYYRRRVQERYDKLYGAGCGIEGGFEEAKGGEERAT